MELIRPWVGYTIAAKLKELGFAEACMYHFKHSLDTQEHTSVPTFEVKNPYGINYNTSPTRVSAPLWQQLFNWFDEQYNFFIVPSNKMNEENKLYSYTIHKFDKEHANSCLVVDWSDIGVYSRNFEAQNAVVNKILELIEKK